jgi:membrane-associated phospholipid phosphatase
MSFLRTFRVPLFIILAGGFLSFFSFQWDVPVRQHLVSTQQPGWKKSPEHKFHSAIRKWGDWPPIMVAAALGYILLRACGNRRWSRIILLAMLASTLAGILANASRLTTGRTRPRESPKIEQGFYGPYHDGRLLIGVPSHNSFPSGHTATAFGFAALVFFAAPVWGIAALLAAAVVAWSSIAIGAHHPSDVVVSVTVAFLVAWFVWRIAGIRFPLRTST